MPRWLLLALGMILAAGANAAVYPLPPDHVDMVGEEQYAEVQQGETLLDIARRHGLGYMEMKRANPGVDMWIPEQGSLVIVPTRHILPPGPREGIVLNVAEMRLYYYPPAAPGEQRVVETYPVSIGRADWSTPIGTTHVTGKLTEPAWYPPASVRAEAAAAGHELPARVPPGPDNPIGKYALRLGIPGYFIHGTNDPWRVGLRVTHGCIRMYPEHIEDLFQRVPVGTAVRIINEPYKAGWYAGRLYLQVHPPLEGERDTNAGTAALALDPTLKTAAEALAASGQTVDHERIRQALEQQLGVPVPISGRVGVEKLEG